MRKKVIEKLFFLLIMTKKNLVLVLVLVLVLIFVLVLVLVLVLDEVFEGDLTTHLSQTFPTFYLWNR